MWHFLLNFRPAQTCSVLSLISFLTFQLNHRDLSITQYVGGIGLIFLPMKIPPPLMLIFLKSISNNSVATLFVQICKITRMEVILFPEPYGKFLNLIQTSFDWFWSDLCQLHNFIRLKSLIKICLCAFKSKLFSYEEEQIDIILLIS